MAEFTELQPVDDTGKSEQDLKDELERAAEELAEAVEERKRRKDAALLGLSDSLDKKLNDVIRDRQLTDQRWLEDLRQMHGYYGSYVDPDQPFRNPQEGKRVRVNITRPKALTAMSQMLLGFV